MATGGSGEQTTITKLILPEGKKPVPPSINQSISQSGTVDQPPATVCMFSSFACVQLFATPWTAACQAFLSITNSRSLLKLMSIESVMPSNHLILCRPLLLLPSIFPSISVFSNESVLPIRWPKYWSFLPKNIQDLFPLGLTGLISL